MASVLIGGDNKTNIKEMEELLGKELLRDKNNIEAFGKLLESADAEKTGDEFVFKNGLPNTIKTEHSK